MSDVSTAVAFFPRVNEGFISTTGGSVSSGASTVPLTNISGLVNGSVFVGLIEPGQAKEQAFTGIVDTGGSQITGVHWTKNTNVTHVGGVTVVDYVTGTVINLISTGILKQHNQDGTHGAITAASLAASGAISAASSTISGNETIGGNLQITGTSRNVPVVIASAGTITPSAQIYDVTALAVAATIAVPSFTAANGQAMLLRITDNGTARALTFAAGYSNVSGLATPTTTVAGKMLTIGALYNSATSKWEIQGLNQSL